MPLHIRVHFILLVTLSTFMIIITHFMQEEPGVGELTYLSKRTLLISDAE